MPVSALERDEAGAADACASKGWLTHTGVKEKEWGVWPPVGGDKKRKGVSRQANRGKGETQLQAKVNEKNIYPSKICYSLLFKGALKSLYSKPQKNIKNIFFT